MTATYATAFPAPSGAPAGKAAGPAFVSGSTLAPSPPPSTVVGPRAWMREHLFTGPVNIALTIVIALMLAWLIPPFIRFVLIDAVWSGANRDVCIYTPERTAVISVAV